MMTRRLRTVCTIRDQDKLFSVMRVACNYMVSLWFVCVREADVMSVNVSKRALNGSVQQVVQKMVTYTLYEKSQTTVYEQQQAITILTQKVRGECEGSFERAIGGSEG